MLDYLPDCLFLACVDDVASLSGMASRLVGATKLLTFQASAAKPTAQLMRGSTFARQQVIIRLRSTRAITRRFPSLRMNTPRPGRVVVAFPWQQITTRIRC